MKTDILKNKAFPAPEDLVQFSESHRVGLSPGDYSIKVTQNIKLKSDGAENADLIPGVPKEKWVLNKAFSVAGERFHLSPDIIHNAYPPKGGEGDYWTTLPHIVLNRSTLPWERKASKDGDIQSDSLPWLALIVLHPEDLAQSKVFTGSTQEYLSSKSLPIETGTNEADNLNLIKVNKDLLPSSSELKLLSHVRRRMAYLDTHDDHPDPNEFEAAVGQLSRPEEYQLTVDEMAAFPPQLKIDNAWNIRDLENNEVFELLETEGKFKHYYQAHETATVIANRLPHPGGQNRVHLVSLEGLYEGESLKSDFVDASDDTVTLVSLFQWQFYCQEEIRNFRVIMNALNVDNSAEFQLPVPEAATIAKPYLESGFVPLKHHFREGSRSRSWYHGPLVPLNAETNIHPIQPIADMHIRHADQLVVFDNQSGLFDVSYAAAWQLGRLLTLQNTRLALEQLEWKKRNSQRLHSIIHQVDYGYDLAVANDLFKEDSKTALIAKWLDELTMLQHIPFQYLVPDEGLLPRESIRFFSIDPHWIECLRDGAFSIGRVLEQGEHKSSLPEKLDINLNGFLLRSEAVSGWPQLIMKGYKDIGKTEELLPVRKEIIGNNVMLVLFETEVQIVDFYLPPEQLHFGFDLKTDNGASQSGDASDNPENLVKTKRDPLTGEEKEGEVVSVSLKESTEDRILDLSQLLNDLGFTDPADLQSATLAVQLMNGNDIIQYSRKTV